MDVTDLVASNNATVLNPGGAGIPSGKFQRILNKLLDQGPEAWAICWAVVTGEDSLFNPKPCGYINFRCRAA
jgi:hypothetical protein